MTPLHTNHQVTIHCLTYNHAPYIEDAMNGFCLQETSFPFLAIICDDASTDGEQDVIRKYLQEHFNTSSDKDYQSWETEEAKIVFAQHKTNSNCSFLVIFLKTNYYSQKKDKSHLWKEWEESAKYIALCEGDDYWIDPQKLQKQVDFLENNPEYSMCWHDAYRIDAITHQTKGDFSRYEKNTSCNLEDLIIGGGDYCPTASFIYRRSLREAAPKELFNQYVGDYPLQVYMALTGNVFYINQKMSIYRVNTPGSWVSRSYDYSCIENRRDIWPKEIKMYHDLDNFSQHRYTHYFKQQEYKYMFREMIKLHEFNSARKYWYKMDYDKRPWDWILIINMHGRYTIKTLINCFLMKIRYYLVIK